MADIRKRKGEKQDTYQVRYLQKNGKSGYKTFLRRKDAQLFIESLSTRKPEDSEFKTMNAAVRLWLDVCRNEGRGGRPPVSAFTYQLYEVRGDLMCEYDWGKGPHELNRADVVKFRSWLLRRTSRYMASKTLLSLHSVVKELIDRDILLHDPVSDVTIQLEDEEVDIPTAVEVKAMLKATDDLAAALDQRTANVWAIYRPMIWLAVGSGMRPQEYLALPHRDVMNNAIRVSQALKKTGDIGKPKTKSGLRIIPIEPQTMDILHSFIAKRDKWNPDDLIFGTRSNTPISTRNYRNAAWFSMMEKAGLLQEVEENGKKFIRPKYHPYALRHYYASMLIANNIAITRIQKLMGHKDPSITLNTYAHIMKNTDESDADLVRAAVSRMYVS